MRYFLTTNINTRLAVAIIALLFASGCAQAPPNLTPEASIAFQAMRAVKVLDLLRDIAIDAHAQVPPLLAETTTRKVVLYHQSTVKIIQASPGGWTAIALSGLDELVNNLSPPDKALLAPYVALVKTIIQEVTRG